MSWDLGLTDLEKADDGGPMSSRTVKQNPRPSEQPASIPPNFPNVWNFRNPFYEGFVDSPSKPEPKDGASTVT